MNRRPPCVQAVVPSPDGPRWSDPRVNTSAECAADRDQTKPAPDSTCFGKLVHREDGLQWDFRLASRRTGAAILATRTPWAFCFRSSLRSISSLHCLVTCWWLFPVTMAGRIMTAVAAGERDLEVLKQAALRPADVQSRKG